MTYGSICSGIEAVSCAWEPLGFKCRFLSEIAAFPRAVLQHHYPEVPLYGDFTQIPASAGPVDVLVGGTPCQSFSTAGLRGGLADPRGNLALEFLALAERLQARWLVWENVCGVLSNENGNAFARILGIMAERGYGFAYRVLDARFFGVPQRRRRVFIVGYRGADWRPPAAVLFEPESRARDDLPRGTQGQSAPPPRSGSAGEDCLGAFNRTEVTRAGAGNRETVEFAPPLTTSGSNSLLFSFCGPQITSNVNRAQPVRDGSPSLTGAGQILAFHSEGITRPAAPGASVEAPPLDTKGRLFAFTDDDVVISGAMQVGDTVRALRSHQSGCFIVDPLETSEPARCLTSSGNRYDVDTDNFWLWDGRVRRLTPLEWERLQGFPDGWTAIPYRRGKPATDTPRYHALGNSMAVPVLRWLGERLLRVDTILRGLP